MMRVDVFALTNINKMPILRKCEKKTPKYLLVSKKLLTFAIAFRPEAYPQDSLERW